MITLDKSNTTLERQPSNPYIAPLKGVTDGIANRNTK